MCVQTLQSPDKRVWVSLCTESEAAAAAAAAATPLMTYIQYEYVTFTIQLQNIPRVQARKRNRSSRQHLKQGSKKATQTISCINV